MRAVPKLWPGETAVLLGGGPSLTPADVEYCRGKARVVAINDAYRLAPWADVLYACDARWWRWHADAAKFPGLKFSIQADARRIPGVIVIKNTGIKGIDREPTGIRNGRNSGIQAINLCVHLGITRIVLLGYDMDRGPAGREHWFGDHPNRSRSPYPIFRRHFEYLVAPLAELGVAVVNCSRTTALTVFPRAPLESIL